MIFTAYESLRLLQKSGIMPRNLCMMHIFLGIFLMIFLLPIFHPIEFIHFEKFFSFVNVFQKFILNRQVVDTWRSKDGFKFPPILKVKFFLA